MPAGAWLCLKNLHLMAAWLPVLEKAVHVLAPHPDFRLFLTTEPHSKFPVSLLQACFKVGSQAANLPCAETGGPSLSPACRQMSLSANP